MLRIKQIALKLVEALEQVLQPFRPVQEATAKSLLAAWLAALTSVRPGTDDVSSCMCRMERLQQRVCSTDLHRHAAPRVLHPSSYEVVTCCALT